MESTHNTASRSNMVYLVDVKSPHTRTNAEGERERERTRDIVGRTPSLPKPAERLVELVDTKQNSASVFDSHYSVPL